MAKIFLHLTIIFLVIARCIGPRSNYMCWSPAIDRKLLDFFYGLYPPDENTWDKVKEAWDNDLPYNKEVAMDKLKGHVYELRLRYWNEWLNRSGTEREQMEDTLLHIYNATKDLRSTFNRLLELHPEYHREFELYRTVVYRWYERNVPLGKEIMAKDVDWTPQRKADVLHILDQVREGAGHIYGRMKERWSRMYEHLNVEEKSLTNYAYILRRTYKYEPSETEKRIAVHKYQILFRSGIDATQDKRSPLGGQKVKWTDPMNADLLYIHHKLQNANFHRAVAVKDRWDRMHTELTHLTGEFLLARIRRLHKIKYKPEDENIQKAKEKYEELPPIPQAILSRRTAKRKTQPFQIREGQQLEQEHQYKLPSPSIQLTPELLEHLHEDMAGINSPYAEDAHYPYQTDYHGSSSKTPIEQGPFDSLPDTPHSRHQWYPGGSSSHTSIHEDTSGLIAVTPHPGRRQEYQSGSSSHTPIDQGQFTSLPHTPYLQQDFSHPGSSSSYIYNQPNPYGSLPDTPHPHHFPWNPSGSSDYTPIYQNQTDTYADTSRPGRRQRRQGGSSRHP